jgi:exosome complex RNA-binding protein Csl4
VALADPAAGTTGATGGSGVNQAQTSGTIVVGGGGQESGQLQAATETNEQGVDPDDGSVVIGSTGQTNQQQSNTQQQINQTESGTFLVIGNSLHQSANQVAETVLSNGQLVGGSLVIGNVTQTNSQNATINQSINQSLSGTFVILGGTDPAGASSLSQSFNGIAACGVCADAVSETDLGLVGGNLDVSNSPNESTTGTYIVTGDLDQSFDQTDVTDLSNNQSVDGSIIIGNVSQSNAQNANVNQSIDQSLSGTYLIFGSLNQDADQLALVNESNNQQTQGG